MVKRDLAIMHKCEQLYKWGILSLIFLISINTTNEIDYSTILFSSLQERSLAICTMRKKILRIRPDYIEEITPADMQLHPIDDKDVILLFRMLPSDFEGLYKIFDGIPSDYEYKIKFNPYVDNSILENHRYKTEYALKTMRADIFDSYGIIWSLMFKIIPKEFIFPKLIGMGIGGFWSSDIIGELSWRIGCLFDLDPKLFIKTLEKYNDDEIASLWYFIFDEPHPEYNKKKKEFEDLYCKLYKHSPRIANQMKRATNYLICHKENRCPNH
jgi:hypothetical protein